MGKELDDYIGSRSATTERELDFVALVRLIDRHYDRLEATVERSVRGKASIPSQVEAIFDSVTDALMSVGSDGRIRTCNKICPRYFKSTRSGLIDSPLSEVLPAVGDGPLASFLLPFMSNLDDTQVDIVPGEVVARRMDGTEFIAEINASELNGRRRCDFRHQPARRDGAKRSGAGAQRKRGALPRARRECARSDCRLRRGQRALSRC